MVKERARILVVGGGYVGMSTALRLQQRLKREIRRGEAQVTVVAHDARMTYRPLLAEAAAGSVSPRHVVVPLRRVLDRCRVVIGEVTAVDHARRTATLTTPATGEKSTGAPALAYDELVLAPDSGRRTPPVPGLAEHGIGLTTVEEAIGLRNHVIEQMDIASSTRDPELRDAALTFVFVGGGRTGIEALAALEDMARHAARSYHNIRPQDMTWILVEASGRALPEADADTSRRAVAELRGRNIQVVLDTRLESCADRVAVLSDGRRVPARTIVWTAGAGPHPLLAATGMPLDARGRLVCTSRLAVEGVDHVWAAGDAASVSGVTATGSGGETARQARLLGDNIAHALRGEPLETYAHRPADAVASLGLHKGVARLHGRGLTGYPAWFMHRVQHLSRVPTLHRKARVLAEWTLSGFFEREIVSLGSLEHPQPEFELAPGGKPPRGPSDNPKESF
ncbi:NAD(P)/FAD-dependent oxidoreductase [Streptomyces sp. V3I7]|uniref:NAD(P)/FAD-dependent oxidoreductase n=1 Tax=Streptomyces sp. V3I7 TaxID=3042278 RepID=UPI00277FDC7F|nr:FAD-dependent oxidoreductase [Streptomyces sp. V3I7]MDQ0991722.1 NADH dehydrogenase [Streptomyces sp. V3I7]